MRSLEEIVEQGDLDQLVRTVDRLCETRDWDGLVEVRDRCRWALERGKQLWPAASLAEYRLALEAPGKWAAGVLAEGAGRFALGPLPEVAASTHSWGELAPHLAPGPLAAITAHERVLRGEDLRGEDIDGRVLEVPLALTSWEPEYPLAEYEQDKAAFPSPPPVALSSIELDSGEIAEDPTTIEALLALTTRWTVESNGRSEAVAVRGTAPAAIAALGVRKARVAEIAPSDGLAWMAWAAASGGAHGRRRGMATGRFDAWWAAVALADALDDWPLPSDEIGDSIAALRWFVWDAYEPETGWVLRLAIEDPDEGMAWAVAATDQA